MKILSIFIALIVSFTLVAPIFAENAGDRLAGGINTAFFQTPKELATNKIVAAEGAGSNFVRGICEILTFWIDHPKKQVK